MRFGVFHVPMSWGPEEDGPVMDMVVRESLLADELGFDVIFLPEHHFTGYSPGGSDPFMVAAYLAPQLKQAYLGFAIIVVPINHPVRMAERINLLDHMTGGKALFGVGSGFDPVELLGLGTRPGPGLADETDAGLQALLELLDRAPGDPPTIVDTSTFSSMVGERIVPAKRTERDPLFLAVGARERSIERAAKNGWPVFFLHSGIMGEDMMMVHRLNFYREQLAAQKHSREVVERCLEWTTSHFILCAVADTDEQAKAEARIALEAHVKYYEQSKATMARAMDLIGQKMGPAPPIPSMLSDEFIDGSCLVGSPESVIKRLEFLADLGIGVVNVSFNLGTTQEPKRLELTEKWMKQFASDVMPALRDRKPPTDPLAIKLDAESGPTADQVINQAV